MSGTWGEHAVDDPSASVGSPPRLGPSCPHPYSADAGEGVALRSRLRQRAHNLTRAPVAEPQAVAARLVEVVACGEVQVVVQLPEGLPGTGTKSIWIVAPNDCFGFEHK